jgi:hypothetical protein
VFPVGRARERQALGGGAHHSERRRLCKPSDEACFPPGFLPARGLPAWISLAFRLERVRAAHRCGQYRENAK